MLAKVNSGCIQGIEAFPIEAEVDVSNGMPSFSVVGLPDVSIRESRDRIRSAVKNSGFTFPDNKITVNLSPAGIKKEGSGFDLPIAIGILTASGAINMKEVANIVFCGELSLDGKLKPFRGALPIALSMKRKCDIFILPEKNAKEASNINELTVFGANSLREVVEHIKGISLMEAEIPALSDNCEREDINIDMKDVKGQEYVKRGLEVAACGGHNMLLIGPPGSGKSMLAKRFATILPELSRGESLETTNIYSVSGELKDIGLMKERPIRSPHHTISYAAMAGGGSWPSPGEISLAHNGVLFLDELPEFRRDVLEVLRQPLESGEIIISRVQRTLRYPSRFIMIGAMNPCPCGYFTDTHKRCNCSPHQIQRYLSKVSGPLLDRIDLHLEVPRLNYEELSGKRRGESSEVIRERVLGARDIQKKRFRGRAPHAVYNAYMKSKEIEHLCPMTKESEHLLKTAILELGISARAYAKILKISRTLADMEEKETIESYHISEAVGYRCLDRNLWV